jgi:hypothetical protein
MVSNLLDFRLGQVHGVHNDRVMHWLGSGSSGVVIGDHEEVKEVLTILFNNTLVNNRAWTRVADAAVGFLKKSKRHLFIYKNKEKIWIISFCE